jgi:hypothetical protein
MLFVFLGKKLISVDTICPVLMAVKIRNPKSRIFLFTFDRKTIEEIKKNIVLHAFIAPNTTVFQIGGSSKNVYKKAFQKLLWSVILAALFLFLLLKAAKAVHFGALDKWPYKLLSIFNRQRIFFFENNCWGYSPTVVAVDQAYSENSRHPDTKITASKTVVGFSKDWPYLCERQNFSVDKYLVAPSRSWPAWTSYIEKACLQIWKEEQSRHGLDNNSKIVFFALGAISSLPYLDFQDQSIAKIVEKTCKILLSADPDIFIFLKPHPITNLEELNRVVRNLSSNRIVMTHLHPSLVARYAELAICNYYSTTMADCHLLGIKTVEYTRYNKTSLALTNGKSLRPEFISDFIDIENEDRLSQRVREILTEGKLNVQKKLKKAYTIDEQNLIDKLAF